MLVQNRCTREWVMGLTCWLLQTAGSGWGMGRGGERGRAWRLVSASMNTWGAKFPEICRGLSSCARRWPLQWWKLLGFSPAARRWEFSLGTVVIRAVCQILGSPVLSPGSSLSLNASACWPLGGVKPKQVSHAVPWNPGEAGSLPVLPPWWGNPRPGGCPFAVRTLQAHRVTLFLLFLCGYSQVICSLCCVLSGLWALPELFLCLDSHLIVGLCYEGGSWVSYFTILAMSGKTKGYIWKQ